MRIVILSDRIPPENVGGAGKVAWALAVGLSCAGHDVHVIAATEGKPFQERREDIPTYHLHARYPPRFRAWLSLYNPQTIRPLRRLLKQIKPDVVNAHNIHIDLSYASLSLAHSLAIPTVFTSHDVMPFAYWKLRHFVNPSRRGVESPAQYRLPPLYNLRQMWLRYNPFRNMTIRRILERHVQVRTCVSEALRQALEANGLPPFRLIYNGLDPASLNTSDTVIQDLRRHLDLMDKRVILFAGRITADKGSLQLLAALNRVVKRAPNAVLLVLTSKRSNNESFAGPEYQELSQRHVQVGGWLSGAELAAAYHLADVVVVPSIYLDPLPTVALEGMAAAKPVVATCYGGSPEIVVDGETGYVVNPFDTETFADRLERLLLDPALGQTMGQAGRRRLDEKFTLAAQVENMVTAYEDAIKKLV